MAVHGGCGLCVDERRGLVHTLARGSVVSWSVPTGEELGSISVTGVVDLPAAGLCVHPTKLQVFVPGKAKSDKDPGVIFVFSLTTQRCLATFAGHTRQVTHILWVHGYGLLTAANDGTCRLWDSGGKSRIVYETGRSRTFLSEVEVDKIRGVAVSGSQVYLGCESGGIEIVDLRHGKHTVLLPLWHDRRLLLPEASQPDTPPPEEENNDFDKSACKLGDTVQFRDYKSSPWQTGTVTNLDPLEIRDNTWSKTDPGCEWTYHRWPKADEEAPRGAAEAPEKPLARKRKDDYSNGIVTLVLLDDGRVFASTLGELLLVEASGHESLEVFKESYAGCLVATRHDGEVLLFAGNRGFDAKSHEVIRFAVDPFRQVQRVKVPDMVVQLYWSPAVAAVFVMADDKGLYYNRHGSTELETVFISEEDRDSMDNEVVQGIVECRGKLVLRTSFSRLRIFSATYPVVEEESFKSRTLFGIVGRKTMCVDRATRTLVSMRNAGQQFDDFKLDVAEEGADTWTRHSTLPLVSTGEQVEVVKDGEPDNGMGYPGKYRVRNASGMETVVSRQDLGGFMLLGKGWPPAFMEHVETPDRSMLLVGGELGGLIEYFCASRTAVSFEGGQAMEMAGETTRGVVSACSAWDASGAFVVISTRRQGSSVYDWETRKHHGNLPSSQKSHSRFAFLPGASDAARVAAWEAGGLIAWDVRALVRVWQVSLEIPVTSFVGAEHQLFTYQFTKGAPLGRLSLWCTQSLENVRAESLDFGPVEYITSMLLLPTVGLLTAHMPISVGILVWDPTTGDRLYTLTVTNAGSSLHLRHGPGELCALWSATNGRSGYLKWNSLTMFAMQHAEQGVPKFSWVSYLSFFLDIFGFCVSVLQLLSFALKDVRHADKSGEVVNRKEVDVRLPKLFDAKPFQEMADLARLSVSMFSGVDVHLKLYAACSVVILFTVVFFLQDSVKERAFLRPKSCFPTLLAFLNKAGQLFVQTASLPLFKILFIGCWSHWGASAPLLFLVCLSFRLIRAGCDLSNIAADHFLDIRYDAPAVADNPKNLVSGMSPAYDNLSLFLKYFYTVVELVGWGHVTTSSVKSGLSFAQAGAAMKYSPVMERAGTWLQVNSVKFALDVGSSWILVIVTLAFAVQRKMLPDGEWLDALPLLIVPLFFIAFLSRPFVQTFMRMHSKLAVEKRDEQPHSPKSAGEVEPLLRGTP